MPKNVLAQRTPELTRPTSIKHLLQIAVDEAGDNIAYKYRTSEGIREVTFKRFQEETFWLGTALNSLGMAKGLIGFLLPMAIAVEYGRTGEGILRQ